MKYAAYYATLSPHLQERLEHALPCFPKDAEVSPMQLKKNRTLLHRDDELSGVFVLISGCVSAISAASTQDMYTFSDFTPVELFGEQEILSEYMIARADIRTKCDCSFLFLDKNCYFDWVMQDTQILLSRTKNVLQTLLRQTSKERSARFLNSFEKLAHFLVQYYETHQNMSNTSKPLKIWQTHEEISSSLGCSVRTVSRAIQFFLKNNDIFVEKGKITINHGQYLQLKQICDSEIPLI